MFTHKVEPASLLARPSCAVVAVVLADWLVGQMSLPTEVHCGKSTGTMQRAKGKIEIFTHIYEIYRICCLARLLARSSSAKNIEVIYNINIILSNTAFTE